MKNYFFIVVIALLLSSCATPLPIYQLKPAGKIELRYPTMEMTLMYERTVGELLIFDIAIKNLSDSIIEVNPTEFYCYSLRNLTDTSAYGGVIFATDPEYQITSFGKTIDNKMANYDEEVGTNGLVTFIDFVGDVINIGKKTREEKESEEKERCEREREYEERKQDYYIELERLIKKRSYWENKSLRKTTIFSEKTISGKIHFSKENFMKDIPYLKVKLPIAKQVTEYTFEYYKL